MAEKNVSSDLKRVSNVAVRKKYNIERNIFMGKMMRWIQSKTIRKWWICNKRKRGYQFFAARKAATICNESHKRSNSILSGYYVALLFWWDV